MPSSIGTSSLPACHDQYFLLNADVPYFTLISSVGYIRPNILYTYSSSLALDDEANSFCDDVMPVTVVVSKGHYHNCKRLWGLEVGYFQNGHFIGLNP